MSKFCEAFIFDNISGHDLARISGLLDLYPKQPIGNLLWSINGYKPDVNFILAYTNNSMLLKYAVKEESICAVYRQINDPVYKDTCVEAFIAFDGKGYYNLEFNCLGTALVGFGAGKEDRINVNPKLVNCIKTHHAIKTPGSGLLIEWELTLDIPFAVFEHHHITSLNNQACKANFYKCGDELPEPHFLSWNNIIYPHPNFHLPEFFGDVKFVP
jgi:hypothetical protein